MGLTYFGGFWCYDHEEPTHCDYVLPDGKVVFSVYQTEIEEGITLSCIVSQDIIGRGDNYLALQANVDKAFEKYVKIDEIDRGELMGTLKGILACLVYEYQKQIQEEIDHLPSSCKDAIAELKEKQENPWFLKK